MRESEDAEPQALHISSSGTSESKPTERDERLLLVVVNIAVTHDREFRGRKSRTRCLELKRSLATSEAKITPILSPLRVSSIKKDSGFFQFEVEDSDGLQCATSDDEVCVPCPHTSCLGTSFKLGNSMLG